MSQNKVNIPASFQIIQFLNFLRGRLVSVNQVQQLRVEVVRQGRGGLVGILSPTQLSHKHISHFPYHLQKLLPGKD